MTKVWSTFKLEQSLTNVIDQVVQELFIYGSKKYHSRSDFARVACIELLKKEGIQEIAPVKSIKNKNNKIGVVA